MSALSTVPLQEPSQDGPPAPPVPAAGTSVSPMPTGGTPVPLSTAVEFHYTQTDSFVALLHQLRASLLVSTYQANKLLLVRAAGAGLSTLVRTFDKPMGLAADARRLALGTRNQVWFLRNAPDIAPRIEPDGAHDACYLPRSCHVTGDIAVHEMAWAGDELWLVNTRFSCLCSLDPDYSFVPRWRPPFITALAAEDRCHLNGLCFTGSRNQESGVRSQESAVRQAQGVSSSLSPDSCSLTPAGFVTALGETDTPGGWRRNKPHGGILMDIPSGEIVARGLSMPHSPRWHDGRLWLLESGTGRLLLVDTATGQWQSIVELPGFARGLSIVGPYAFIGLSKIREGSAMTGVPLAERREQLKCGVAVVDLRRGQIVAFLEFQTAVEEIFDVQVLPGVRFPEVIGFQKDTFQHIFIVPQV